MAISYLLRQHRCPLYQNRMLLYCSLPLNTKFLRHRCCNDILHHRAKQPSYHCHLKQSSVLNRVERALFRFVKLAPLSTLRATSLLLTTITVDSEADPVEIEANMALAALPILMSAESVQLLELAAVATPTFSATLLPPTRTSEYVPLII